MKLSFQNEPVLIDFSEDYPIRSDIEYLWKVTTDTEDSYPIGFGATKEEALLDYINSLESELNALRLQILIGLS